MYRIKTKGLVLRSCVYGEADKMLTVLTADEGKISVAAKGGKSLKKGAFLNNFCYCDFALIKRGGIYGLESAQPIEDFFGVSKSVEALFAASSVTAFAAYICEESTPSEDMLRLCLNSLYALSSLNTKPLKLLVAFYIKAAEISGYSPETACCANCQKTENLSFFSPLLGGTLCEECGNSEPRLNPGELKIMRFILNAGLKDILKFSASDTELEHLYSLIKLFSAEHFDYKIKDWGTLI